MKIVSVKAAGEDDRKKIMSVSRRPSPPSPGKPSCCGPAAVTRGGKIDETVPGFQAWLSTGAGPVPRISTQMQLSDRLGAWKARWGIGRMSYIVPSGLYAVGHPSPDAPVLVTANYKMTFDLVRQAMAGRDAWLLVLETFGINVWCAAGKGTFGTGELIDRIQETGLAKVVNHRRLLLPILGAPGVAAHEVTKRTGFSIVYATIRAEDLPEYLENGMTATAAMRQMTFSLRERAALVPVELVLAAKSTALAVLCLFVAGTVTGGAAAGLKAGLAYLGAVVCGIVAGPLLLPWLPGRSFACKGAVVGLAWGLLLFLFAGGSTWGMATTAATFLALPAVSAFYTLNFTGCTPFTSRSGVKKELRIAVPLMGAALGCSLLLVLAGRFF